MSEDLSARERLRDAGLRQFAAHGYEGTNLRAVAAEAGVTVGLIRHHFGSKEGLRDAVELCVVGRFADAIHEADLQAEGEVAPARERDAAVARMLEENPVAVDYLRREVLHLNGSTSLVARLAVLTAESVDTMREAGHAARERHRVEQVVGVVVRQLGRLFLQPLVDQVVDVFPEEERPAHAPRLSVGVRSGSGG